MTLDPESFAARRYWPSLVVDTLEKQPDGACALHYACIEACTFIGNRTTCPPCGGNLEAGGCPVWPLRQPEEAIRPAMKPTMRFLAQARRGFFGCRVQSVHQERMIC